MAPKVSVVVPFYNVEQYLDECLASIARQTLADLEVVMVDDGSPDGSVEIARAWGEKDERFVLVQQENQGLGPARNTGAGRATGEYITFVDSDDVLPVNALELLAGSLDKTGSDFASGNVRRFNSQGTFASGMHREVFKSTRLKTHVSKEHRLLQDRIACNKVFRKAFWDEHGFAFPEGRYEDIPVTIPAHALAGSVDILRHTTYLYRVRDGGGSITQQRLDRDNMADRVVSVISAARSLQKAGFTDLKRAYDRSVLEDDFLIFVYVLPRADDEYRKVFCEKVREFIDGIEPGILEELRALNRLVYHLVREEKDERLLEVADRGKGLPNAVRKGDAWYGDYPFFGDPEAGVPDEVYRLGEELVLRTKVRGLRWERDRLLIEGHAYIDLIGAPSAEENRIGLQLRHVRSGLKRSLTVEQYAARQVTAESGRAVSCDWAAFRTEVDLRRLKVAGYLLPGNWEIVVTVQGQGVTRSRSLSIAAEGTPQRPAGLDLESGARVVPWFESAGRFLLKAEKRPAVTKESRIVDGVWRTRFALVRGSAPADPVLMLSRRTGATTLTYPMQAGADGVLTAEVPIDELVVPVRDDEPDEAADDGAASAAGGPRSQELDWEVFVCPKGTDGPRLRAAVPSGFRDETARVGDNEVCATKTRYGNLVVLDRSPRLVIDDYEWGSEGALRITGTLAAHEDERPSRLVLRRRLSPDARDTPLSWSGERFTAEFEPHGIEAKGAVLGLSRGKWALLVDRDGAEVPVVFSRTFPERSTEPHRIGLQHFTLARRRVYEAVLEVAPAYRPEERGPYAQSILQGEEYPRLREEPLKDMVLFESYFGRQFSCNPRAVFEELKRRDEGLELVWATEDGGLQAPDGARSVLVNSREYVETLARAKYIVSNCGLRYWYVKREGQFYLQTWHGSPLKRVGLDVEAPAFEQGRERLRRLAADARKWDLLLSQSPEASPVMRRAMAFEGEVAEVGYPRNDALHAPDAAERGARVRERLGIPEGKKAVLYAPTWRDDENRSTGAYGFELMLDIELMRRRLGRDHVLLLRLHHLINRHDRIADDGFVLDVSRYPDVNDLMLASDVLVTDYSSVMFDYAGTGRPVLCFAYDYEHYRDSTRGLSFDLEECAPGELLETSEDVVAALEDMEAYTARNRGAYERFRERFCPHEDGDASARAVDRMLAAGGTTG